MRGCAGGKGVLQSRIAAGELILRPPAESGSLALPGSGRGRPEWGEGIGKSEELWCAALRHGFGKYCFGEAGGKGGQFGFRWGRSKFGAKKKARSAIRLQAPACGRSGQFQSQTVWYHKKGRGRVWENRRFLPHMERSGSPCRSGRHLAMPNALAAKEKGTFRCPFLLVRKMGLEPTHRSTGF